MAVPKGKVSKARRDKRRSSTWKLAVPGLVACSKCGALHLPHRMCPECGTYKGREVKVIKSVAGRSFLPQPFCCPERLFHGPSTAFLLPSRKKSGKIDKLENPTAIRRENPA